jgi:hypothetical protein
MFEAICVRRTSNRGAPLDVGLLVEALVFYQRGHVVADSGALDFLISGPGPEFLLELIDRDALSLSYLENMPGCLKSEKPGRGPRYDFALVSSPQHTLEQSLPRMVRQSVKDVGKSEHLTRRLFSVIKADKHHTSIPDLAREDANNAEVLRKAVEGLIKYKVPNYAIPSPLHFRLEKTDDLFAIHTNLDFDDINRCVRQSGPQAPEDVISPESLLVHLPDVSSDLHFAAKLRADLLTPPENSLIAASKLGEIFSSMKAKNQDIGAFQEFIFEDGRAIREAVNTGARTLKDSLALIDASARFKQWLKDKDPSADLLKEYCRELSRLEWADKLPIKGLRWLLFAAISTVAGALNPALGLGVSAADTFLVDRLLKGWKPNQFIEGPLRKFLLEAEERKS